MKHSIENDQWVYVLVHGPEGNEQILGQQDTESNISFIPVFTKKEDALMNINLLARDKKTRYEPQAIIYEDLVGRAAGQGFMLFVMNQAGEVVEKLSC